MRHAACLVAILGCLALGVRSEAQDRERADLTIRFEAGETHSEHLKTILWVCQSLPPPVAQQLGVEPDAPSMYHRNELTWESRVVGSGEEGYEVQCRVVRVRAEVRGFFTGHVVADTSADPFVVGGIAREFEHLPHLVGAEFTYSLAPDGAVVVRGWEEAMEAAARRVLHGGTMEMAWDVCGATEIYPRALASALSMAYGTVPGRSVEFGESWTRRSTYDYSGFRDLLVADDTLTFAGTVRSTREVEDAMALTGPRIDVVGTLLLDRSSVVEASRTAVAVLDPEGRRLRAYVEENRFHTDLEGLHGTHTDVYYGIGFEYTVG